MSEIRVNRIVNAEGSGASALPYGLSVSAGIGITGAGGINVGGPSTIASSGGITTCGGDIFAGDSIGVLKDINVGAAATISGTTESTSSTTGAITAAGGVGIAKDLFVGDAVDVAKDINVGAAATIAGITKVTNSTSSTSTSTGALIVTGGVGVGGDVWVGAGLSVAGTLTYEDVTNVDSVGLITAKSGINVTAGDYTQTGGGEFKVGTGVTISSTAGVSTFSEGVTFLSDNGASFTFDPASSTFNALDSAYIKCGSSGDLLLFHDGTNSYLRNITGNLEIQAKSGEAGIRVAPDGAISLAYDANFKLATTNEGVNVSGMMSATAGIGITGGMWEGARVVAGKLSDNTNIDIADGNIWHYTTAETTTCTPNIRWNSTYSLANKVRAGSVVTLNVITTAAAAGYSANWTIDGSAVTEEWNGGSAPSAGGSGGYDVYTFTLIHKPGGSWVVLGNVSNFA